MTYAKVRWPALLYNTRCVYNARRVVRLPRTPKCVTLPYRQVNVSQKGKDMSSEIYRSDNGDRWLLVRERNVVRHEPNLASGGQVTETFVDEFL